jgi:hypothetical protein
MYSALPSENVPQSAFAEFYLYSLDNEAVFVSHPRRADKLPCSLHCAQTLLVSLDPVCCLASGIHCEQFDGVQQGRFTNAVGPKKQMKLKGWPLGLVKSSSCCAKPQ